MKSRSSREGKTPLDVAASSICDLIGVGGVSNTKHNITTSAESVTLFQVEIQIDHEYRDEQGYKSTLLQVYKIHPT
jgi:hypothetical protein